MNSNDKDFIEQALNFYWNDANTNLQRKDLGDIERGQYQLQLEKSKRIMDDLSSLTVKGEEKTLDNENLLKGINCNGLLDETKEHVATQNGFDSWSELLTYYEEHADEIDPEDESTLENIIDDVSCKYGYDLAQIIARVSVPSKKGVDTKNQEDLQDHPDKQFWGLDFPFPVIVKSTGKELICYYKENNGDRLMYNVGLEGTGTVMMPASALKLKQ